MFERFTDRARRVVVLGRDEANLLGHSYIGTEHLLLGLLAEGDGTGAKALNSIGVTFEAARTAIQDITGRGNHPPGGQLPFTPRTKKVMELSLREALQLGHNYIGTEHILLAIVREGEGVAVQVLVKLGTDGDVVRKRVIELLSGYEPRPVPTQTTPPEVVAEQLAGLTAEQSARREARRQLTTRTLHVQAKEEQLAAALRLLREHWPRIKADHPIGPIIRAIEQELD